MHDYTAYIIIAYGITAIILIGLWAQSYRLLRRHKKELKTLQKEDNTNDA